MSSQTFSTTLQQIAQQAATDPNFVFYTVVHHIDEELLGEAFRRLRKDKAPGIDGQTAAEYAQDLIDNLRDLHERLKSRQYRATPIKSVSQETITTFKKEKLMMKFRKFERILAYRVSVMMCACVMMSASVHTLEANKSNLWFGGDEGIEVVWKSGKNFCRCLLTRNSGFQEKNVILTPQFSLQEARDHLSYK